jgi:hypothetical protein
MVDRADRNFDLAMAILADHNAYIADHKVRRWDVLKWGVSINLAFATASAFKSGDSSFLSFFLFFVGMCVSLASIFLIQHYNRRMTGTRDQAKQLALWFEKNGVDYEDITGAKPADMYPHGEWHDLQEIVVSSAVLLLVPFLCLVRVVFERIGP